MENRRQGRSRLRSNGTQLDYNSLPLDDVIRATLKFNCGTASIKGNLYSRSRCDKQRSRWEKRSRFLADFRLASPAPWQSSPVTRPSWILLFNLFPIQPGHRFPPRPCLRSTILAIHLAFLRIAKLLPSEPWNDILNRRHRDAIRRIVVQREGDKVL